MTVGLGPGREVLSGASQPQRPEVFGPWTQYPAGPSENVDLHGVGEALHRVERADRIDRYRDQQETACCFKPRKRNAQLTSFPQLSKSDAKFGPPMSTKQWWHTTSQPHLRTLPNSLCGIPANGCHYSTRTAR